MVDHCPFDWQWEGDRWKVTGVTPKGQRFPAIHTKSPYHAMGINLFRGTVWQWREGHWRVVKRVFTA